ncbi:MAG: hypothetical protein HYZ48_02380 [Chlamydiales bacterium]|nr:hypothetical protein [Chlamydiales bacterium]
MLDSIAGKKNSFHLGESFVDSSSVRSISSGMASAGMASVRDSVEALPPKDFCQKGFTKVRDGFLHFVQKIKEWIKSLLSGSHSSNLKNKNHTGPVIADSFLEGLASNRDPNKLREIPREAFDLATVLYLVNGAVPPIDTNELLDQFDAVCREQGLDPRSNFNVFFIDEDGVDDDGNPLRRQVSCADARLYLSQGVHDSEEGGYLRFIAFEKGHAQAIRRQRAEEVEGSIKGVIFKLREGVPAGASREEREKILEKRKTAIIDLCKGAMHCPPRRHTEAIRVYRFLSGQMEDVGEIMKQGIQEVKEELFKAYYSLSREPVHTLNYIRQQAGVELGLDARPVNIDTDQYLNIGRDQALSPANRRVPDTTRADYVRVFQEIYTPYGILTGMKRFLNEKMDNNEDLKRMISQYLADELQNFIDAGKLSDDDFDLYLSSDYSLTDEGVRFLMVHFQYLAADREDRYLVRQPVV